MQILRPHNFATLTCKYFFTLSLMLAFGSHYSVVVIDSLPIT
jgi:hypothetical protein